MKYYLDFYQLDGYKEFTGEPLTYEFESLEKAQKAFKEAIEDIKDILRQTTSIKDECYDMWLQKYKRVSSALLIDFDCPYIEVILSDEKESLDDYVFEMKKED